MKRKFPILFLALFLTLPILGASVETAPVSAVRVFPNPWRADKHATMSIRFENLPAGSTVKIFTVSAHEVKILSADSNGSTSWDRTNNSGERIASGVYIYLVIDSQGNSTSGKLAVIE